jgi:ankyrin repeat protein
MCWSSHGVKDGRTAAHFAAQEGHYEVVRYLVSAVADLATRDAVCFS